MEENYKFNPILSQVREYAFKILDKESKVNSYTTISKLYRVEKNIKEIITQDSLKNVDVDSLLLANSIQTLQQSIASSDELNFEEIEKSIDDIIRDLKEKFSINDALIKKVKDIILQSLPSHDATMLESQILSDAAVMDFSGSHGRDRLKSLYEELILKDIHLSRTNWYDILIPIIENYKTYTTYAKTYIQPSIEKLVESLKKERKELENQKKLLIKKELQISDKEIKKLKKDLSKIKNRDEEVSKPYSEIHQEIIIP